MNEIALDLLRQLVRTGHSAEAKLDALLGLHRLTATKLLALRQIDQAAEPLLLSQLAVCMAFAKSNATQLVDQLERDHLVSRVYDRQDRRCILLQITEQGQALQAEGLAELEPLLAKLDQVYTAEEQAQLTDLLKRLDEACK